MMPICASDGPGPLACRRASRRSGHSISARCASSSPSHPPPFAVGAGAGSRSHPATCTCDSRVQVEPLPVAARRILSASAASPPQPGRRRCVCGRAAAVSRSRPPAAKVSLGKHGAGRGASASADSRGELCTDGSRRLGLLAAGRAKGHQCRSQGRSRKSGEAWPSGRQTAATWRRVAGAVIWCLTPG